MISPLRLAGAAALCAALLLSACAKKTDQTTTTTDTSTATTAPAADTSASTAPGEATGTSATAAPVIPASTAPDTSATTTASSTTASGSSGGASGGGYITLPVYPGSIDAKDNGTLSVTTNTGSVQMKSYMTKDDAKKVSDWYKSQLPASFKNSIMTVDTKTMGTFVNEHTDGDQSIIVASQSDGTTRIQLTTKHGK